MAVTRQDLEERARQLGERAEADLPESWQPHDPAGGHPQTLVGHFLRREPGHTVWGPTAKAIVRDAHGKCWCVWLFHQVLRDKLAELDVQPGDLVAVSYKGTIQREPPLKPYEGFRVEVGKGDDLEVAAEWARVDWGEGWYGARAEAVARDAAVVVRDERGQDLETPAPMACEHCRFEDPHHAQGCPNGIPF